jgi:hypothetical protein
MDDAAGLKLASARYWWGWPPIQKAANLGFKPRFGRVVPLKHTELLRSSCVAKPVALRNSALDPM